MRRHLLTIAVAVALLAGTGDLAAQNAQKLYRWMDDEGRVHYSDQLPPEAVKQAREELNQQGLAVRRIERALTPQERAEYERERLAGEAAAAEQTRQRDRGLLASYGSETDLSRAYDERFALLEQSVTAARLGLESQEDNLAGLLEHAAALERSGRAVPQHISAKIIEARRRVEEQRSYLTRREAERVALSEEYQRILTRYRELRSGREE